MKKKIIEEAAEILKQLSPENQEYFMTLVRVAEAAENSVKNDTSNAEGNAGE